MAKKRSTKNKIKKLVIKNRGEELTLEIPEELVHSFSTEKLYAVVRSGLIVVAADREEALFFASLREYADLFSDLYDLLERILIVLAVISESVTKVAEEHIGMKQAVASAMTGAERALKRVESLRKRILGEEKNIEEGEEKELIPARISAGRLLHRASRVRGSRRSEDTT